ncbi:myocardin-related transcription factor A isoform X2 [Amia ocellicauda]|uniref:myocardin-related transcription factor A isoform X2 n=1 Tax=Amia ocellicauda TaxID=2972642 RepID=UPI003463F2EE
MTLLASERSLLIRNKFRSVLQLRIQNRRQQHELNENGVKTVSLSLLGEKDGRDGEKEREKVVEENVTQTTTPCGHTSESSDPPPPGPVSYPVSSEVFDDDIMSSSSSSPEQLRSHQSPGFSSSPGHLLDQSLSDVSPGPALLTSSSPSIFQCSLALLPATEGNNQTMIVADSDSMATPRRANGLFLAAQTAPLLPKTAALPPCCPATAMATASPTATTLPPPASQTRPPRSRKARDVKPKMKKLKYHQYIPPDQRASAGGGAVTGGGAVQGRPGPPPPIDPAYSRLLQQQQVFLQLQILNQQQQEQQPEQQPPPQPLTITHSGDQILRLAGTMLETVCKQPLPLVTNPTPCDPGPTHKPELLPANLDDLTVSELRQQLRKRGLPVSGTKPSLLERLRPYQLPRAPLTPPQRQPHTGAGPTSHSHADARGHPMYLQPAVQLLPTPPAAPAASCSPPASSSAATPPPPTALPPSLVVVGGAGEGAPWQQPPPQRWREEEMSVEAAMQKRMRSRREREREREREVGSSSSTSSEQSCENSLHPFLQQETGSQGTCPEGDGQSDLFTTQIFCSQPCDVIGQDFDLPLEITASPTQAPPTGRTLEEELQEAIQRVQMAPSQSIDDILDEPVSCEDSISSVLELQPAASSSSSSTPPIDQSQPLAPLPAAPSPPPQDTPAAPGAAHFLSSPLCSSLSLELPSSPLPLIPSLPLPPPPAPLPPPTLSLPPHHPPLSATPTPSSSFSSSSSSSSLSSRKRRREAAAATHFDPADWLEALTCGLRPSTPPAALFLEPDFSLDSDLNVNRVLDLMIEQW